MSTDGQEAVGTEEALLINITEQGLLDMLARNPEHEGAGDVFCVKT